jgi:excisionase family DNA binding protein
VNDRLLTTREVAEYLGFSPETLLRRHRSGELVGIQFASNVLRFRASEIESWLEECSQPVRPNRAARGQRPVRLRRDAANA